MEAMGGVVDEGVVDGGVVDEGVVDGGVVDGGVVDGGVMDEGIVAVWRVDLREVGEEPLHLLSVGERERAARIGNPARRALWMRGRGMLRVLLGGYLKRPARELEFVVGKHGKLALADGAGARARPLPADVAGLADATGAHARSLPADAVSAWTLHFNLSHSGPMALYAFTAAAPVGVDLELAGTRSLDEAALAERTFGAETARRLRELDAPARGREFLRLWVRHEAALKCLGEGLFGAGGDTEADTAKMWIVELDLGLDMAGAVAVQGGPQKLRVRDWPPQAE